MQITLIEWFSIVGTAISLYWGYLSYKAAKGELERLRRHRKLPKLLKERQFFEKMHASPSLRTAYLIESVLIGMAGVGVMLMFSALDAVPPASAALQAAERWLGGGAIYLFSLYRLGRYHGATTRYEKTLERLNAEITKLQV